MVLNIPASRATFVFPFRGTDPTRPMTTWKTAWKNLRKAAGLEDVKTHDGRRTVITTMAEQGIPITTIEAVVGHSKLILDYVRTRRSAMNEAVNVLQPSWLKRETTTETEMVN